MKHCFHVVDFTLHNPDERCCWCNQPRREPMIPHPDRANHGPYLNPMTLLPTFIDRSEVDCPERAS